MKNNTFFETLLDNLKDLFLFADKNHIIQYMNLVAEKHYKQGKALIGSSIFDCHNEKSRKILLDVFEGLQSGEDEHLIVDNERYKVYMRAVRNNQGELLGYYERYEPPSKG